jgi:hypothetical protein
MRAPPPNRRDRPVGLVRVGFQYALGLHIADIVSIGALPDRHHDTNPGMLRPPRLLLARENFADPRADGRAFLRHRIGLRRTRPSTREIFRNVQQAAQGNLRVSSNITDVQRGASETGSASSQVLSAARALSRRAGAQDRSQQLLTRCALHSSMYIEQTCCDQRCRREGSILQLRYASNVAQGSAPRQAARPVMAMRRVATPGSGARNPGNVQTRSSYD